MKLYFLLITCFLSFNLAAEPEWKKRKEESGITIYTRAAEGADLDEFKGLITLHNTTLTEVLDVILDINNYPKWIPDCVNAKILFQDVKYHDIHYFVVKAPWPISDRDAIYEMTTTLSNNNKHAHVELKPRGDYIKEKKKFVRLHKGSGFWELKEIEENKVKLTYQFIGDPGGKIPAWVANSFVVTNPYHTLINLKDMIGK